MFLALRRRPASSRSCSDVVKRTLLEHQALSAVFVSGLCRWSRRCNICAEIKSADEKKNDSKSCIIDNKIDV